MKLPLDEAPILTASYNNTQLSVAAIPVEIEMVGVVEEDEPAEDNLNHQLLPPMAVPTKPSRQAVSGAQIANELAQFQAVRSQPALPPLLFSFLIFE